MYYINMNTQIIIGSSPESFVAVQDGTVITNPIAGTIKRGKTIKEDKQNAEQLLSDEKELSEHRMLVDLGRNDLHRVSRTGSSKITKLMEIEKYEHVMHIVSEVKGEIKQKLSPMTVIANLLPTGTVSGAPKLRAIRRIYETYPYKRGLYSGGVGYINCNQNLDFALAIRTMLIDDTTVKVEAGCGVVYDSVPEKIRRNIIKSKKFIGGNTMILIIDNYDSFTYNLVDIVSQLDDVIVKYPDDKDVLNYVNQSDGLIISPGPGHPLDSNHLLNIIERYKSLPILGVCLGAQAITCYYGGRVIQGEKVMHGKVDILTVIQHTKLYNNLANQFNIMRYHSLISDEISFPSQLIITGRTKDCIQSYETKMDYILVFNIIPSRLQQTKDNK